MQPRVPPDCSDAAEETEDYDFIDLDGIPSRRGSRKGSRDDGGGGSHPAGKAANNFGKATVINEQETDKEK